MSDHFDVIVIGAGSIGTTAAYSLAKDGVRTLVIDALKSVGQGSNKAAIGGVRATHSDPAKIRLCMRSIEMLSGWQEQTGDDIEWFRGGYVFTAYREKDAATLKNLIEAQTRLGLNIRWLDRAGLLCVVPDLCTEDLLGGTYSPEDGHCSPLLTLHSFYEQAKNHGAVFQFDENVIGLEVEGGRVRGVRTSKGVLEAPVVINAAGSFANPIAMSAGIALPVKADAHEAGITEAVAPFLNPLVVDIRPGPGSANVYFFQHRSGQVIFCMTPSPLLWGEQMQETSGFLPTVAQRLVALMPRLAGLRVRRTWRGLYPMTPDGSPIVGFSDEVEGFLIAAGMCGQGFMLGPGLGELLSRMVRKAPLPGDDIILSYLSPKRSFGAQERLK